jgi:hypothetical protein
VLEGKRHFFIAGDAAANNFAFELLALFDVRALSVILSETCLAVAIHDKEEFDHLANRYGFSQNVTSIEQTVAGDLEPVENSARRAFGEGLLVMLHPAGTAQSIDRKNRPQKRIVGLSRCEQRSRKQKWKLRLSCHQWC